MIMQSTMIEIPLVFVLLIGVVLASVLIAKLPVSRFTGKPVPLVVLQKKMGLGALNSGLFFLVLLFWAMLFLLLFGGLIWNIAQVVSTDRPIIAQEWRFALTKLVALTGVLGATVALPFTLIRLNLSRQQLNTALDALINDKMNIAVADLHAQRQVTEWYTKKQGPQRGQKRASNGWEDDITRRNGAIDRLLGLVQENAYLRPRVDRLLTVYLRELTREFPAEPVPEDASSVEIRKWANGLSRKRSDMENAVQVLSRLPRPAWKEGDDRLPDLQDINMQAFNLSRLTLKDANLYGAKLQGANLFRAELQGASLIMAELQGASLIMAQLQGANLSLAQLLEANLRRAQLLEANLRRAQLQGANLNGAQLQGANLFRAELQGANLSLAQLQEANLRRAQLQGANLNGAQLQGATSFSAAMPDWAALKDVDLSDVPQIAKHLEVMFGDRSVTLPEGVEYPDHWPDADLDMNAFMTAWRDWQRAGGFDPDNPQ
jgi:uncharacterized protein YjbI with pentapeptide repeats